GRHAAVPYALLYCAFCHICNFADASGAYYRRTVETAATLGRHGRGPDQGRTETRGRLCARAQGGRCLSGSMIPEKWEPVFGNAQTSSMIPEKWEPVFGNRIMLKLNEGVFR